MTFKSLHNRKHWLALYTKPRSEKKVAERLAYMGYETYCPVQTVVRLWSDRKKKVKTPVIPSYVFIKVEEIERNNVLQDPGVLNFVFWLGKPAIVPDDQIKQLQEFLENHDNVEISYSGFNAGDKVVVKEGAFKSEKGEIVNITSGYAIITLSGVNIQLKAKLPVNRLQQV